MNAVKVGDRVKATLGSSVLIGEVAYVFNVNGNIKLRVDDADWEVVLDPTVWHVEVLPPPVPSWAETEGAVCRFDDTWLYETWVATEPDFWLRINCTAKGISFAEMCARYGTAPVLLFDPTADSHPRWSDHTARPGRVGRLENPMTASSVASIAAGVAADIRKYGHAQSEREAYDTAKCCVAANPTCLRTDHQGNRNAYRAALARLVETDANSGIIRWNDNTPTVEVLAVLDELAATG